MARRSSFGNCLVVVWCLISLLLIGIDASTPPKCKTFRSHGLYTADCGSQSHTSVPTYLHSSSIEVLYMSVNRIRMLKNDSFTDMSNLKLLFLHDNSIATIETGAFYPLDSLEILDLSLNSISVFSPDIYLPSPLRKLNISDNPLKEFGLGEAVYLKEIHLTASYDLERFPRLGQLPLLHTLNLTGSTKVRSLNVSDLAGLCNLNELILPENIFNEGNRWASTCECLYVTNWIYNHSISYYPARNCTPFPGWDNCAKEPMLEAEGVFAGCQTRYESLENTHWVVLSCAIVGVILCVLLLGILWRRKCHGKKRRSASNNLTATNSSNSTSSSRLNKSSCDAELAPNERKLIESRTTTNEKNSRF